VNLRQRLLESENHTGELVGEYTPVFRADYEDALVQALEDTLYDSSLLPFRSFLKKWRLIVFWPEQFYLQAMHDDKYAWYVAYYMTCELRRMGARYEHAYNKLLQMGVPKDDIPTGQEQVLF
jgi:hypothetical protein